MSNPYNAWISLKIGDIDVTEKEENMVSLTNTITSDSSTFNAVFNLFDVTGFLVEAELVKGNKNITYSYGYDNGISSRVYSATVVKFTPNFTGGSVQLQIEALPTGAFDSDTETPKMTEYKGYRIDQIVKIIAQEEGWTVSKIVVTEPVPSDAVLPDDYKVYTRNNKTAQEFIEEDLIPDAISDEGEGNYILRLIDTDFGTSVYFAPQGYKDVEDDDINYTFQLGVPNENIIEFSPEIDDTIMNAVSGTTLSSDFQDSFSNEYTNLKLTTDANYEGDEIVRYVGGNSYTAEEMGNISKNLWAKMMSVGYNATLTLQGTVGLQPNQFIEILVLTKDGYIHHTTGVYLITEIEDSIEGGNWTTTLTLLRNALSSSTATTTTTGTVTHTASDGWGNSTTDASLERFECDCAKPGYDYGWCNGWPCDINLGLVSKFEQMEQVLGVTLNVTSGVRCEQLNSYVGGVTDSLHLQGYAIDSQHSDVSVSQMITAANQVGLNYIEYSTFLHVQPYWDGDTPYYK